MNTIEFFEKLGIIYANDEDKSNFKDRICIYANMLDKKLKEQKAKPDFDSTIEYILENYQYRAFPPYNYILENLKYEPVDKKNNVKIKLRGFTAKTDIGTYDFWGYLPEEEKVEYIRGFKVIKEIPVQSDEEREKEEQEEKEKHKKKQKQEKNKLKTKNTKSPLNS